MIKPLLYALVAIAAYVKQRCITITDVPRAPRAIPDANGGLKARQPPSIFRANNTERASECIGNVRWGNAMIACGKV
jgi:hypothetical protein